jgi:anti-sigma28 factor (negative regulator of flagellin synthesis)
VTQNPKVVGVQLLEAVQIMYQNAEIDAAVKNKMVTSIKEGIKTGNFKDVNRLFRLYSLGTSFGSLIEESIQLTN